MSSLIRLALQMDTEHSEDSKTTSEAMYCLIRSIFGISKTTTNNGLQRRLQVYIDVIKLCNEGSLIYRAADNIIHLLIATADSLPSTCLPIIVC